MTDHLQNGHSYLYACHLPSFLLHLLRAMGTGRTLRDAFAQLTSYGCLR